MGFSINDVVTFGKHKFDLQTETKDNKIIGEILCNGQLLKKVEREYTDFSKEKEIVLEVHQALKTFLIKSVQNKIETLKKDSTHKLMSINKINKNSLQQDLLKLLEVDRENLKIFFFKKGEFKTLSIFDDNYKELEIDNWLESVERLFQKTKSFSFYGSPHFIFIPIYWKEEKVVIILLKESLKDIQIALAISKIRLSILRNRLSKKRDYIYETIRLRGGEEKKHGTN